MEEVLDPALALARRSGSHVIGLYVYAGTSWPPMPIPGSGQVLAPALPSVREQAEQLATTFARMTSHQPFTAEWRSVEAPGFDVGAVIVDQARCCDLVVAAQASPDRSWAELPERLAVESGRPVLAVPHTGLFPEFGRNVLIAWKSTREAARAVFDALPLLKAAEKVHIVEVVDAAGPVDKSRPDVVAVLGYHDISATFERIVAADTNAGPELLSQLAQKGADLLVMGAYGHSRTLQFVFGGVTRHVARQMTVPTLWSH
ncbi:MAG: universal stress protein [Hyphomicrobiaceae bacterium]